MFPSAHGVVSQGGREGGGGGPEMFTGVNNAAGWTTSSGALQYGWRFVPQLDIEVRRLRFYAASAREETVRLWRSNDQQLLVSTDVASPGDAFGETDISPVALTKGHAYVVTHHFGGASRTFGYNPTYDLSEHLTRVSDMAVSGTGYPSLNAGPHIVGADIAFTLAPATPPAGSVTVSRAGSATTGNFGTSIYGDFTPTNDVWLRGIRDANQPAGVTVRLQVWEWNQLTVMMAQGPVASQDGGAYESLLDTPIRLLAGMKYRIGWLRVTGSSALRGINGASTWTGYTAGTAAFAGTTPINGWYAPFDLVEAA